MTIYVARCYSHSLIHRKEDDMKFAFDKFMSDIVGREEKSRNTNVTAQRVQNDSAREYNRRYREHWQNSTFFSDEGTERSRWRK